MWIGLGRLATKYAWAAFAKGERHGGALNATTYPRKWFGRVENELEMEISPGRPVLITAKMWRYFSDVYDAHLFILTQSERNPEDPRQFPIPTPDSYI